MFGKRPEAHELASRIYYRKGDTVEGDQHAAQSSGVAK
jgi:hypothetical protein